MYICIAGQNKCAIEALKFILLKKFNKDRILVLTNHDEVGKDSWKPS